MRLGVGLPTLVVNLDPTPESSRFWSVAAAELGLDVVERPRAGHGTILDWVVAGIAAERVLLVDSDAEVRNPAWASSVVDHLAHPRVFGGGFFQPAHWLRRGEAVETVLYSERAWTPCMGLRVEHVRAALDAGLTFQLTETFNDFRWSRRVSRVLAARLQDGAAESGLVARLPAPARAYLRRSRLAWMRWARAEIQGFRPSYVVNDTGAAVYRWCRYERGLLFAGLPAALRRDDDVFHVGGLSWRGADGPRAEGYERTAVDRLRRVYGLSDRLTGLAGSSTPAGA